MGGSNVLPAFILDWSGHFTLSLFITCFGRRYQRSESAFSWTLPKTVLDISITYQYTDCLKTSSGDRRYIIKVTPTVIARAIPDPIYGGRAITPGQLNTAWQDRNLNMTTFANSHIINTVGAHPVGQAATIIGNVLTGIAKIVSIPIALGAPLAADETWVKCEDKVDKPDPDPTNPNPGHLIQYYQQKILALQKTLGGDNVSDTQQKQVSAQIQALQTLLQQAQAKMSFAIKTTIDPGYTDPKNVPVGTDAPPVVLPPAKQPPASPELGAIPDNGLIASIMPTMAQMADVPWISGLLDPVIPRLRVNVNMDMKHAMPVLPDPSKGYYSPTQVHEHPDAVTYRDVAYIPVIVSLGDEQGHTSALLSNTTFPFAQYGRE
jgi:hypothetical protein